MSTRNNRHKLKKGGSEKMSIATNLKRKRMDKQLTQKELAKKTGVSGRA